MYSSPPSFLEITNNNNNHTTSTMAPRFVLPARLPITRTFRAPARFNSNTSTSRAARVIELASQAEKPSALEAGVPVMWAACGVFTLLVWNRIEERAGTENVEKVCWLHEAIQRSF